MNHTKGPWTVESLVDGYDIQAPEAGCFVATASDPEMVWGAVTRKGDAHLIAAAPELLEALENLLKVYEGEGGTQHHAGDMARAAIAKAKGS